MKKYVLLAALLLLLLVGRYNYKLRDSKTNTLDSRAVVETMQTGNSEEIISSGEIEEYNKELGLATEKMNNLENNQNQKIVPVQLAKGNFDKQDPIHRAKGEVQVKQAGDDVLINFSDDFIVPDGPDLYVMLSKGLTVKEIRKLDNLQLGPLIRKKGSQTYKITQNERNIYSGSLNIRCRAFDTYFSVAKFENDN